MQRILFVAVSLLLGFCQASSGWAQNLVPYGQCAVVVASRSNIAEARQYIYEHGWQDVARVFESNNGWFAIALAMVETDGSTIAVSRMKRSGAIPSDAYCSRGERYIREVNWRSVDRDWERPVSAGLWAEFDARPLTEVEKRFLQAALAMEGYYNGLLDGVWGNISQGALERFTASEFGTVKPANAHAAYLTAKTINRWLDEGWNYQTIGYLDLSMLLPMDQLRLTEKDGLFEEWHHSSKNLVVSFNDLDDYGSNYLHLSTVNRRDVAGEPYTLRGPTTWVTSVRTRSGTVYVRSDLIAGSWSTVVVTADHSLKSEVSLISSSIRAGAPAAIVPPEHGVLITYMAELITSLGESSSQEPSFPVPGAEVARSDRSRSQQQSSTASSTGTAFFVTEQGLALTNAHVVENCGSVSLDAKPAEIVAVSAAFDLAFRVFNFDH